MKFIRVLKAEENSELKKYVVIRTGGSIGNHDKIVDSFDNIEEAKDYAKRMRKHLTPGERSYYGMSYKVFDRDKLPSYYKTSNGLI